jgi:uncharacterized phiE125 gp8 family phage protein
LVAALCQRKRNAIHSSQRAGGRAGLARRRAQLSARVEHNDDDEVIAALVAGSRIHVEAQTRRALITQSWRTTADSWPQDGRLPILPAPLRKFRWWRSGFSVPKDRAAR